MYLTSLELKELKELKPNGMQVSEYWLLTPERSDNSSNFFNFP